MDKAKWYVIQVQTGKEQAMCQVVERVCAEELARQVAEHDEDAPLPLVDECFAPRYRTRMKVRGEWQDAEKLLLPGYVIAVSRRPEALAVVVRRVIREFARMLSVGETFVPLRDDERTWIDTFTKKGDRTVPMSMAVKRGDTLVVTDGPLQGKEAMITKVNRKKCLAFVELHVGGKRITTRVGLGIVTEDKRENE